MKKPLVCLLALGMALALSACAWRQEGGKPPGDNGWEISRPAELTLEELQAGLPAEGEDPTGSPEEIADLLARKRAISFVNQGTEVAGYAVLSVAHRQTLEKGLELYEMAWGVQLAESGEDQGLAGAARIEDGYYRDDRFNTRVLSLNEDGTYTDLGSPAFDLSLQEGLKAMLDEAYQRGEAPDLGAYGESEYRFTMHRWQEGEAGFAFRLGRVFGAFPWENEDLADIAPAISCGDDAGVDCYSITIPGEEGQTWVDWYTLAETGRSYISRLRTTDPAAAAGALTCGMNEPRLLSTYPDAAEKPELQPGGEESWCDFDKAYVFVSQDYRPAQEIRYYVKDGFISGVEMKMLLD